MIRRQYLLGTLPEALASHPLTLLSAKVLLIVQAAWQLLVASQTYTWLGPSLPDHECQAQSEDCGENSVGQQCQRLAVEEDPLE